MADIAGDVAVNPDAQAAVTDFLDYTEYLPADLIRSLTLIRGLDETYLQNADAIHDLVKTYSSISTSHLESQPNAQDLRGHISSHLDLALNARESAYAEACRLFDLTDRHQNRLKSIISKLKALPKPPSRDPTPQPQAPSSAKRSRTGRKIETGLGGTRLTLKPPKGPAISLLSRPKHRRVTVPGEVLPPYDPDEPIASTEASDWESDRAPSPVRPILKLKQPKPPKASHEPGERKPREIVQYRKPTPPPDDAEIGGKYRPWTHLTEYEMYRLRKKMKKNHTWEPSEVMIRRELAEKGRGWENYYKARADAIANGTKFNDIGDAEKHETIESIKTETPKPTVSVSVVPSASASTTKTVKRSESRREKREEAIPNKASLAAQEAELAARRLGDMGSMFKNLFSPGGLRSTVSNALGLSRASSTPSATAASKKSSPEKSQKKRKLDEANISESPSAEPETQSKKPKIVIPLSKPSITPAPPKSAGTIKIPPLKLTINPAPSSSSSSSAVSAASSSMSTSASSSRAASVQRSSAVPKSEASPAPVSGVSSRRRSAVASVEPGINSNRPSRRASMTPVVAGPRLSLTEGAPKAFPTAILRRSKRDAPGTVTQSSQDGGAAVSVSKRKAKPKAQRAVSAQAPKSVTDDSIPQVRTDIDGNQEILDPDEERYCICGDVSFGEMICCELDEKCEFGQWFHMECIKLIEHPPRTAKWYCPGDRKKYHRGETSNGLVGRGIK